MRAKLISHCRQTTPIPIAPVSTKLVEMSSVEIPKDELKGIPEILHRIATESKIGVMSEEIFGDSVLK